VRDSLAVCVGCGRVLDVGHVHGGEGAGDEGFEGGGGHVGGLELGFEDGLEDVDGEVFAADGAVYLVVLGPLGELGLRDIVRREG
jgi:hypothetical protein